MDEYDVNATKPGGEAQGRIKVIGARVTVEEHFAVKIAAAKRRLSPSEYVRELVLPAALKDAA